MQFVPPDAKKILNETYKQQLDKPIRAIELPCTKHHKWREPVSVQLTRTGDQKITCPLCGRSHYLIWSKLGNQKYA